MTARLGPTRSLRAFMLGLTAMSAVFLFFAFGAAAEERGAAIVLAAMGGLGAAAFLRGATGAVVVAKGRVRARSGFRTLDAAAGDVASLRMRDNRHEVLIETTAGRSIKVMVALDHDGACTGTCPDTAELRSALDDAKAHAPVSSMVTRIGVRGLTGTDAMVAAAATAVVLYGAEAGLSDAAFSTVFGRVLAIGLLLAPVWAAVLPRSWDTEEAFWRFAVDNPYRVPFLVGLLGKLLRALIPGARRGGNAAMSFADRHLSVRDAEGAIAIHVARGYYLIAAASALLGASILVESFDEAHPAYRVASAVASIALGAGCVASLAVAGVVVLRGRPAFLMPAAYRESGDAAAA